MDLQNLLSFISGVFIQASFPRNEKIQERFFHCSADAQLAIIWIGLKNDKDYGKSVLSLSSETQNEVLQFTNYVKENL